MRKKVNNLSYSLYSQQYSQYTNKKTHLRCVYHKLAGVVGVEPTSTVLETGILPLNYTSIIADCSNIIAYKIINVKKKNIFV